jgi:arylformamidase
MIIQYTKNGISWEADLQRPLDISIPLSPNGPRAWYVQPPVIEPVMENGFVGSIARGGKVNFFQVNFNPHGNGTHTETLGHIDPNQFPISKWQGPYFSHTLVLSLEPTKLDNGDDVILWEQMAESVLAHSPESIVIRTIPNDVSKRSKEYSNTNFPYLETEIGHQLNALGVRHLLVDLPSVDRESDEGKLSCHHAFWGFPSSPRMEATISEMIFVADEITDGLYCLSLQPASFELDAAPSRPILYPLTKR